MGAPVMAHSTKKDGFEQWEIDSAADTLVNAETMRLKNKKLFKLAIAELKKRKKAISNLV
jgi:hypothetical protein